MQSVKPWWSGPSHAAGGGLVAAGQVPNAKSSVHARSFVPFLLNLTKDPALVVRTWVAPSARGGDAKSSLGDAKNLAG